MSQSILIIDDEPDICELISLTMRKMGIESTTVHSIESALKVLQKKNFAAVLTDLRLPDGDGLTLVEHVNVHHTQCPIIVITAHGTMEIAIEALKHGAFDFITKPIQLDKLRGIIKAALKSTPAPSYETFAQLVGDSDKMLSLKKDILKVARSQAPVYISGPSGCGKELVAKLIHENSVRKDAEFIPVNCGAIPSELMEAEFFGYLKGSFSGATQDKIGLFAAADQGTLFLDEVADLPLNMQVKLLRALQEQLVRPIGAHKETAVDVRIICATHKPLAQLVQLGEFREDLFYRINVIELDIPPLNERKEDLEQLIDYLLERIAKRHHCTKPTLSAASFNALKRHHFPGNIRELENILERALTLSETHYIDKIQLNHSHYTYKENNDIDNLDSYLADVERKAILDAIEQSNGNITQAAKQLGISFRTLRYRIKKLNIDGKLAS